MTMEINLCTIVTVLNNKASEGRSVNCWKGGVIVVARDLLFINL